MGPNDGVPCAEGLDSSEGKGGGSIYIQRGDINSGVVVDNQNIT